jgi:putative peptidoglycan lipid II flippase
VLAAQFGAGNAMDAFVVAFRIPNLVRDLFAEGAMSAAFIPAFTGQLTRHGRTAAWRLGNNLLTVLALLTGALVVLAVVFAGPLVTAFAGDYAAVPGKLELTIRLTRIVLPFLTLAAVAAALMGMLNALDHYFIPALAPAMFNVATILGALLLIGPVASLGLHPITAIAIAALAGGVGQVALQWPTLRREGFRFRPTIDLRDPGIREVIVLMAPATIGLAATQVNLLVNTVLATGQGTGAASWLTYGFRLIYLPIGLVGVSIATAVLPDASRHAAMNDSAAVRATLTRGLSLMLLLNVPATAGLVAFATPIVRLLFERGEFLPADTSATAAAVRCYAVGLVGYSAARIASPVFYALGESRVPAAVSTASIAVNVLAGVALVRVAGFRGLALATSIAALANGTMLLVLLNRRLGGIDGARLTVALARITAASLVMSAVAVAVDNRASALLPGTTTIMQSARLLLAMLAAVAALAVSARVLRIPEFDAAVSAVQERVRKVLG